VRPMVARSIARISASMSRLRSAPWIRSRCGCT
jgi:hypothetical protein